MRIALAVTALLLASCATTAPPKAPPSGAGSGGDVFRFDWAPPCRVPVSQQVQQGPQSAVVRYDVSVVPDPGSGELRLRLENFKFAELTGVEEKGDTRSEAEGLLARVTPTSRIASDGSFLGVVDLEGTVRRILDEAGFRGGDPKAAEVRRWMLSPTMLAQMQAKMSDDWNTWVGAWVGLPASGGRPREVTTRTNVFGREMPIVSQVENLGPVTGAAGLVRVRLRNQLKGDDFTAALTAALGPAAPQTSIVAAERDTVLEAETAPATLRPARTASSVRMHMTLAGGREATQAYTRETRFDWDHAGGCGR